jgi:hypothetical protein
MTDDLKQRADAAWGSVHLMRSIADQIQRAVEASIAAALAPLVERVAFLETLLKTKPEFASAYAQKEPHPGFLCKTCGKKYAPDESAWSPEYCSQACDPDPLGDNPLHAQPPPAEAKCKECGGVGFVCNTPNPRSHPGRFGCVWEKCANRRPCPKCSKPEPRRAMCIRHDAPYPCVQCGDLAAPTPSAQKAPEKGVWRTGRKLGRTLYHDDTCVGMLDTPDIAARVAAALNRADLLTARVEELERVAEGAIGIGRREGRAAGIREAMRVCEQSTVGITSLDNPGVHAIHGRIFALLDKTGEK